MYRIDQRLVPVNKWTRPAQKITVRGVVIHWTANESKGADAERHAQYFSTAEVYASAHYFVDHDSIVQIIPDNEMAYHVGAKSYKTTKYGTYPNNSMLGVEMCVNPDGNFQETWKRSVWLTAYLLKKHKLTINELERHYDITGKDCPKYFVTNVTAQKYLGMNASTAYSKFRNEVKAAMNGNLDPSTSGSGKDIVDRLLSITTISRLNSSGYAVQTIQEGLLAYGYNLGGTKADGYYGLMTETSVKTFQKTHGLTVDGIVGPATLKVLAQKIKEKRNPSSPGKPEVLDPVKLKQWQIDQAVNAIKHLAKEKIIDSPDDWIKKVKEDPESIIKEFPWLLWVLISRVSK